MMRQRARQGVRVSWRAQLKLIMMNGKSVVPCGGAILSFVSLAACVPVGEPGSSCVRFVESFQSVAVDLQSLDPDYLNKPLPDTVRRLEAGHDPACVVGGVGDILVQCVNGNIAESHAIIRRAPVIWTDAEGFTVLLISAEDEQQLEGRDLFWANCESDG